VNLPILVAVIFERKKLPFAFDSIWRLATASIWHTMYERQLIEHCARMPDRAAQAN
jgi:hypothetical protein